MTFLKIVADDNRKFCDKKLGYSTTEFDTIRDEIDFWLNFWVISKAESFNGCIFYINSKCFGNNL